jgi:hypothetical protein
MDVKPPECPVSMRDYAAGAGRNSVTAVASQAPGTWERAYAARPGEVTKARHDVEEVFSGCSLPSWALILSLTASRGITGHLPFALPLVRITSLSNARTREGPGVPADQTTGRMAWISSPLCASAKDGASTASAPAAWSGRGWTCTGMEVCGE